MTTFSEETHMQKVIVTGICLAILGLMGCKDYKEQRARHAQSIKKMPSPSPPTSEPTAAIFRGLDLATAPHTSSPRKLPNLWEARPKGSSSYEMRKDVVCSYSGLDAAVYYVPKKNQFYVQHDPVYSSTLTYYGPFDGDPKQVLNLSDSEGRSTHEEQPGSE